MLIRWSSFLLLTDRNKSLNVSVFGRRPSSVFRIWTNTLVFKLSVEVIFKKRKEHTAQSRCFLNSFCNFPNLKKFQELLEFLECDGKQRERFHKLQKRYTGQQAAGSKQTMKHKRTEMKKRQSTEERHQQTQSYIF